MAYFKNIYTVGRSLVVGLLITLRYWVTPSTVITVQYPHEMDPIPDAHRGIHFLEVEKCIMCNSCARACPVDCIDIVGTRDGDLDGGFKGDGCSMSMFAIDYGECLFCGLCIEPCPNDCIHMKPKRLLESNPPGYDGKTGHRNVKFEFDFSGYRREDLVKNLLTDRVFTDDDLALVKKSYAQIDALAAEKKKKKAEAKKKKEEAAKKKADEEESK